MTVRLIRFRDAPKYLGMDRNRFNAEVRLYLTEIPIGSRGIAFDRLDLDAWVEQYKLRSGRPSIRRKLWDVKERQVSIKEAVSGTLINTSADNAFEKVVKLITSKKPKNISPEKAR
jgi:hypothetical protein